MYNPLLQDIKFLQGVGPNRASMLEKELAIRTVGDLLYYYPYKYVDRSRIYRICEIDGNMPYIQLCGEILSFEAVGEGRGRRLTAHFSDGTGVVDLVWFQGIKYITQNYDCHKPYVIFGKPTVFNGRINVAHPEIDVLKNAEEVLNGKGHDGGGYRVSAYQQSLFGESASVSGRNVSGKDTAATQTSQVASANSASLRPAYNTTERMKRSGLTSQALAKLTANMFVLFKTPLQETLPAYIVERHHLVSFDEAMRNIHYPTSSDALRKAQMRLKFEELFYVQLNILRYAHARMMKYKGIVFSRVGNVFNGFYNEHLPFPLTGAQKRVIKEIRRDMGSGRQMNRLLQGDVGSGKTLVALMCALIAVDNGCQACLMAPTEILAEQHVESIRKMLGDMPVHVELLTGNVKGKRRKDVLKELAAGGIHILVGTHAVIEDKVCFSRLGLVIIDEQHRFGVAQRAKLWIKNEVPPHVLVMTATPIPRTLAMTLYGDLDVSVIDELPPGRKPIRTVHQFDSHRNSLYASIRRQITLGRQVYIVYPLIKESEKMDIKNLEDGYEQICAEFSDCKVSKVHGKMKPSEKDVEMQRFASGETQIMVATTVIEVGVNVPNASVMVIENAERFGLSQLHQLRGRVGRGAEQSYCILVTNYKISEDTRKRILIMVDSNDGFEIAEQDLKLRGPGDLEGTQQSGMAFDLKIANLARDGQILQYARAAAQDIIDNDPDELHPENEILWRRLKELRKTNVNWGAIS
ncbi:MAG: ATP-dependent DNA helicase RecG [Prevotellaceae bacterium]|nr:ATP-dependent DNA helicase RecG [Prevotellaceae bacterium]